MTHVYTLKIRYSGEEDDVFLFHLLRDARAAVFEFFEEPVPSALTSKALDEFQEHLFSQDIGYFDIEHKIIN